MRSPTVRRTWLALGLVAGCGRGPGPREGEFAVWEIDQPSLSFSGCDEDLQPFLSFGAADGSLLAYRVDEAGASATLMVCASTDAEGCEPSVPELTLAIDGHALAGERETVWSQEEDCTMLGAESWTIVDDGAGGTVDVTVALRLDGPDTCVMTVDTGPVEVDGCGLAYGASLLWRG